MTLPHGNTGVHNECRALVLGIEGHPDKKLRLQQLSPEDAQHMINFLDVIARERNTVKDARFILSRLRVLTKNNEIFPQIYHLTGVEQDPSPVNNGGFADVYKGSFEGRMLALKVVRAVKEEEKANALKKFIKELTLWAHLSHPNILPFYGAYLREEDERICLVSPWMEKGNLCEYLNKFPRTPRLPIISDIVEGLNSLHDFEIIHGDLKGANILISDGGRALIGDFGVSNFGSLSGAMTVSGTESGTIRWMAPEAIYHGKQDMKSDIWSLGCLCYEALTCKAPFGDLTSQQVMVFLVAKKDSSLLPGKSSDADEEGRKVPTEIWNVINGCWSYNPDVRPTCGEIREIIRTMYTPPTEEVWIAHDVPFVEAMRASANINISYNSVRQILQQIHEGTKSVN